MQLDSHTGVISGTPGRGTVGMHTVTLTVRNGISPDATLPVTLTVFVPSAPGLQPGPGNPEFIAGQPGICTPVLTGTPAPTVSLVQGTLPAVQLDSHTGVISGTPERGTVGMHTVTLTARNGISPDATLQVTLTVAAPSAPDLQPDPSNPELDVFTEIDTGATEGAVSQTNGSTGLQSSTPASAEPVTAAPKSPTPTKNTVIKGSRYEVPLGQETRTIDNSKSSSSTIQVVHITREWARTYALDVEHAMTVRGSAALGIHVLDIKAESERMLRNTYSVTPEERQILEEEVTLNVAPHTKSEVTFFWKEIRQKGVVQISGADFEAQIPYEVVVELTFDLQQVDTS